MAHDRIALSTTLRDAIYPGSGALVQAAGFSSADGVNYFINAADTRTRGIDITLDTTTDLASWGRLTWTAALNFNKTVITDIAPTPSVLAAFNVPVFSVANQYVTQGAGHQHVGVGLRRARALGVGEQIEPDADVGIARLQRLESLGQHEARLGLGGGVHPLGRERDVQVRLENRDDVLQLRQGHDPPRYSERANLQAFAASPALPRSGSPLGSR